VNRQQSAEEHVAVAWAAGASLVRVAAVVEDGDRVLLLARSGDGFLELTWQPPTVHTFADENHRDALHRGLAASTVRHRGDH
jgi:ADP-ribose pyrophosphatase YjhB (NUDIX family)